MISNIVLLLFWLGKYGLTDLENMQYCLYIWQI